MIGFPDSVQRQSYTRRKGAMTFRLLHTITLLVAFLVIGLSTADGQTLGFRNEASVSGILSDAPGGDHQVLLRYVPEISSAFSLSPSVEMDFNLSANLWLSQSTDAEGEWSREDGTEPYRAWVRMSAPRFELRAGLQKISFGSATVFRPLMWFDKVDPRDPLQLTEGVWGFLGRFYLPKNITVWGWALAAEDEGKGWEVIPSLDNTAEAGGRIQLPFGPGEIAATYHHRRFDLDAIGAIPQGPFPSRGSESRYAFDGKWDLEIGLWVEAVFTQQDSEALTDPWTQALSLGMDYTFGLGNGLSVLWEHIRKENPTFREVAVPDGSGIGQGDEGPGDPLTSPPSLLNLSSLTVSYPFGILDQVAMAVYRDWESSQWYRLVEWRRTYDRWRIHLQAFWNPSEGSYFFSRPGDAMASSGSLAGRGLQLIVVSSY